MPKARATGRIPNWSLVQQVIFEFELTHLSITNGSVFAFEEVVVDFVPWPFVFASEGNLNSEASVSFQRKNREGFFQTYWLATNEATRLKSVAVAPLSPHIRMKNCVARLWTL